MGTPVADVRFGDRRGLQLLRMGWLVHSPLTMRVWANSSARRWRRSGGGTVLYLLGDIWRVRDYFDYQARVHGLVPRSCSSLPLLPSRSTLLLDTFAKTRSPVELKSPLISYYFDVLFFDWALALLRWRFTGSSRTFPKSCRPLSTKLSSLSDLSVASICGTRMSRDMRVFEPHQSWKVPGALPWGSI